jgi:hypothetical protein
VTQNWVLVHPAQTSPPLLLDVLLLVLLLDVLPPPFTSHAFCSAHVPAFTMHCLPDSENPAQVASQFGGVIMHLSVNALHTDAHSILMPDWPLLEPPELESFDVLLLHASAVAAPAPKIPKARIASRMGRLIPRSARRCPVTRASRNHRWRTQSHRQSHRRRRVHEGHAADQRGLQIKS